MPGSHSPVTLLPGSQSVAISDGSKIRIVPLKDYLEGELRTTQMLLKSKEVRATQKTDPYPCMMSPCTSGRVYFNAETGQWGFNPSPENLVDEEPLGEMTIEEYDVMRWLNWRESQCSTMETELGIYYTALAGTAGVCLTVNGSGSAALCAAALVGTAYQFEAFRSAMAGCYDTPYTFGGGN